jgi:hypothetical protein
MKRLLATLLVASLAISAVLAQVTSFPPKVGETWRLDVDGLSPATLKFTAPSNANPGAADGTAEMAGIAGKSRSVASQGQYLILWTAKEGTYYCVFAAQPTITGNTVKGLGAVLERPGSQPVELNKGCSATRIGADASSGTVSSNAAQTTAAPVAKPDALVPVPAAQLPPVALAVGQSWHMTLGLTSDVYAFKITKAATGIPNSLGSSAAGWYEASVDVVQRSTVTSFQLATNGPVGYARLAGGALQLHIFNKLNLVSLGCNFTAANLRGNRYTGGALQSAANLTCNAQWAGTGATLPGDASATLENAKRNQGSSAIWNALKTIGYRTENTTGGVTRQNVVLIDLIANQLYRESYQGTGSQQIVSAKEWQTVTGSPGLPAGTYRVEAGSGNGPQRVADNSNDLYQALYTDFWALRFGGTGWDSASLEPQTDGSQIVTAGRKGWYTRYIIKAGKYAGIVINNPVSAIAGVLSATPERFADAGGILAPIGKTAYTALVGQSFSPDFVDTVLRIALNPDLPAGLFEIK